MAAIVTAWMKQHNTSVVSLPISMAGGKTREKEEMKKKKKRKMKTKERRDNEEEKKKNKRNMKKQYRIARDKIC